MGKYKGRVFIPDKKKIEDSLPSCRESSTVRNSVNFLIHSLTPQQAAGNALAVAVQYEMFTGKTGA